MPSLVFIHDPVSGVSMALNAKDKTGSRVRFYARPRARWRTRPRSRRQGRGGQQSSDQAAVRPRRNQANDPNLKTESLGTRSFDGVMADGRRTTMTIPAGQMGNELPMQIVTETWYSSELQATVYQKADRSAQRRGGDALQQHQPRRTLAHAVRRAFRFQSDRVRGTSWSGSPAESIALCSAAGKNKSLARGAAGGLRSLPEIERPQQALKARLPRNGS